MLRKFVDIGVFELNLEPLDARIERRLKQFWEHMTCPHCGYPSIRTWDSSDRIICRNCDFKPVYTYGTPFHEQHLCAREVFLAFIFYADTLLSISQLATVLDRAYKTIHSTIRGGKPPYTAASPSSRINSNTRFPAQHRSMNRGRSALSTKAATRRGTAVTAEGYHIQPAHAVEDGRETN